MKIREICGTSLKKMPVNPSTCGGMWSSFLVGSETFENWEGDATIL